MKHLLLLFLFISFSFATLAQLDPDRPNPIFDFDEVTHITIDISEDDYKALKAEDPSAMYNWTNVLKKHVKSKADLEDFWSKLDQVEYSESIVDAKYYTFFRDTIFKKEGEIQGIAKLCMSCNKASFAPPTVFTDCFGEYNEFDRIKEKGLFE